MYPSLLTTIKNIVTFKNNDLKEYGSMYANRINAVGQLLEFYVKDAVCGLLGSNASENPNRYEQVFSYLGNQNNPPDLIIKSGDAFEIKKIQSLDASFLALNNSPPKDQLYKDDSRITKACREIEGGKWVSKEIFYVVGCVQSKKIKHLFFVHGRCYAADKEIYEKKARALKRNIALFFKEQGWDATETKELGRINRMDPLGITNFRIRGMWEIENPLRVFSYVYKFNRNRDFSLAALMTKEKYDTFPEEDRAALKNESHVRTSPVKIKDPNNPAQKIDAQLIEAGW